MTGPSVSHPAPRGHHIGFGTLMFGCCAAPLFWLGQEIFGYGLSATACYNGDHPTPIDWTGTLRLVIGGFDAVAVLAALAGFLVSWLCWRAVRDEKEGGHAETIEVGDGRARFMAMWGMMSSLWFLGAIVFTAIADLGAPLCAQ